MRMYAHHGDDAWRGLEHLCCYLPAAFLLWVVVQPVETGWSTAALRLAQAIPAIGLGGALMGLLPCRQKRLHPTLADGMAALLVLAVLLRSWMDDGYPCSAYVLRTLLMAGLYLALRIFLHSVPLSGHLLAAGLIACSVWEALLGMGQCIWGGSRHHLYLLTGSFQNPGPYSALPAMGLTMCAQWMTDGGERARRWLWMPLLACLLVLPVTWSRAAWVAAAIGLAAGPARRIRWRRRRLLYWLLPGVVAVATVLLYLAKPASAGGRAVIYRICLRSILHRPWTGGGTGSFFHLYAQESAALAESGTGLDWTNADVPQYAFCDLLRIGVEQGMPGMMVALALAALVLWRLWHRCRTLAVGFLTLLVFSLFSYPFGLLPYQVIAVLLMAWGQGGQNEQGEQDEKQGEQGTQGAGTSIALCLLCIGLWTVHYGTPLRRYCLWTTDGLCSAIRLRMQAERDYRLMAGMRDAAFIDDYRQLMPLLADNPHFLFDFGKMLSDHGRWNDSNAVLRQGARVSADPMFLVVQGNNYRAMKDWEGAEAMYRQAFHVLPNRLYPLYQLMLLYEEAGETGKMLVTAQKITDFNEKIPSQATRQMKIRANEIKDRLQRNPIEP